MRSSTPLNDAINDALHDIGAIESRMGMLPDDIHSVEVSRDGPAAHVHLYARQLNRFPDLVVYDPATGTQRSAPAPTPVPLDSGMAR